METNLKETESQLPVDKEKIRDTILEFEKELAKMPGAVFGDSDLMPLTHSFAPGIYVREIFIPKGTILTGKIHRHKHPNFLMSGEVLVVTENGGMEHLKAPMSMISPAWTKRAIKALEDTVWITVHENKNNEFDLEKIEQFVIAESFEQLEQEKQAALTYEIEQKNCLILALKKLGRDYRCLLTLEATGFYLPFKKALKLLTENGIEFHDINFYLESTEDETLRYHANLEGKGEYLGINFEPRETDLIGAWAGVAIGGGMIGSQLISSFAGGDDIEQQALETPEQKAARQKLMGFADTGTFGKYKTGEQYPGVLGNYSATPLEMQGQGRLASLLSSGLPEIYGLGQNTIKDFLASDKFDPYAKGGVYQGFKDETAKNVLDTTNAVKRNAAFSKNLYSRDTINKIGDVQEAGTKQLTNKLAELYQGYTNQKLSLIPQALNAGINEQNMNLNLVGASQQYGPLQRILADTQAKEGYSDWLRQRGELKEPINSLTSIAGMNSNFGIPSIPTANPWAQTLGNLTQLGAYYFGNKKPEVTPSVPMDVPNQANNPNNYNNTGSLRIASGYSF